MNDLLLEARLPKELQDAMEKYDSSVKALVAHTYLQAFYDGYQKGMDRSLEILMLNNDFKN